MERPTPSDMMPKRDHERDVELDKKIEALRRKNEALMKRYQEVEEDRKRAEEEGMALQSRKGKADDLTITISKSTSDTRVVVTKLSSGGSSTGKGQQDVGSDGGDGPQLGLGRGRRKQLTVTMAGKKGKRVVSEKTERRPGPVDFKNSTDDGQARHVESAGRGKQPTHMTKRDTAAQEEVRQAQKQTEEHHRPSEHDQEFESQQAGTDLTIPTSIEEQEEYLRWKREREQIDRERVARHKNAKGQWRRAWDMDKTENMFSDKSLAERDRGPSSRGGRNARRGHPRSNADSRGHDIRGKEKGAKNVPVVSSKAKGKDRLTGRARRWGANEEETAHLQTSETTLEEFLEQLDALTDAEVEDHKHHDPKTETSESPDTPNKSDEAVSSCDSVAVETSSRSTGLVPAANPGEDALTQGKAEASSPRASEKKVRFSEELIQGARHSASTGAQDSACTESRGQSSLKASPPSKLKHEEQEHLESAKEDNCSTEDQGEPSAPVAEQQQVSEALIASETACTKKDTVPPTIPSSPPVEKASASPQEDSVQLGEIAKCNISNTNTEELIDSNLSVLSLESGETHPVNSTSSDKARENGKIV